MTSGEASLPFGYVYKITSKASDLSYIGLHASPEIDYSYFGSPVSLTGLRAEYQKIWPSSNKLGYKIPSAQEFSEHFSIVVLEWCDSAESLFACEVYWIKELGTYVNGLNRSPGTGVNSAFGLSYKKYCPECEKITNWKSEQCYLCSYREIRSVQNCSEHGDAMHVRDKCFRCSLQAATESKHCEACERVSSHRGGVCQSCVLLSSLSMKVCPRHGSSKFMGESCRRCVSKSAQKLSFCEACNSITSHNGAACRPCSNRTAEHLKFCAIDGQITLHRGEMCYTCNSRRSQHEVMCSRCKKITAHRGESCMGCSAKKSFSMMYCGFCEETTNHRGKNCTRCKNSSIHSRYHTAKPSSTCQFCLGDIS